PPRGRRRRLRWPHAGRRCRSPPRARRTSSRPWETKVYRKPRARARCTTLSLTAPGAIPMIVPRSLSTESGSGSEMQDIPPQGSIADIFFPRLIARLHRDGFEGAVRIVLADTTKVLYLKGGEIASAASNAEADRLASILILEGRLTLPQLEMATSRLQPGGSLGKTLIEMGFLTPSELLQGARRQVRQILGSCCTLSSGSYQIEEGPLPPQVTVLGLSTLCLVEAAVGRAQGRLRGGVGRGT